MITLEYRLNDQEKGFPAIYHYSSIPKEELSLRLLCDYFTKDQKVYEKDSVALEDDFLYIIYVMEVQQEIQQKIQEEVQQEIQQEIPIYPPQTSGLGYIVLELREFLEGKTIFPLIKTSEFNTLQDLLNYTLINNITINGLIWEKTSLEIDEDRKVYILYLRKIDQGR